MAEVVWTDQALEQLDLIVAHIELFDHVAAGRLRTRLFDVAISLQTFPADATRRELLTVPPYMLRYREDGEIVWIVGVRHAARRPD